MKPAKGALGRALDRPDPAFRFYLFYGPDEGQSRAYGERLLKEFSDAALTETVNGPPWMGPSTRVRMIYDAISHCQDIYGQMAVYLRLNGIVPPASRRGV